MLKRIVTLAFLVMFIANLQAQSGNLTGIIKDALTGEPLIGASVLIEETDFGTVTDFEGAYIIEDIPPKTYNVRASYVGYTTLTKYNVVIRSEGNIDLNFDLEESAVELETAVVRPNPFVKDRETPLSIQKLSQEEVAAYPGGNNDIAKVVQSLPGVSGSVGGFRNDVIIRGGAPNENVYYLDGVEIPNINHFATQGSAGGPVGLLNVSFFEGVTLTTSSFGAQYDNALSGVLQFDQRNGNNRKFGANLRVGASETALTLEGPLFKGENEKAKTTYIVSARRSYLQFLFELIGLPILPDYWDWQYKVSHKPNEFDEFIITGIGATDDFRVNPLDEFNAEQQAAQEQVPIIQQYSNANGFSWKRRFKDNSGNMMTTFSSNLLINSFQRYGDNVNLEDLFLKNISTEQETKLRYQLTKFQGRWKNTYGGGVQRATYENETEDLVNNVTFNNGLSLYKYGLFAQFAGRFNRDRLGVSFGLRMDGNTFTDTGNELWRTTSPRAAVSYKLTPDGIWSLNASVGRYFKIPPYTMLGFSDINGNYLNKNAKYIQSDHVVAGLEFLATENSRFTVEGFLKLYNNYPVSVLDSISLANKGGGFEVFGNELVESVGKGRTYGVEFLYQQKFNGKYYAILSYTFYKSEFTGFDTDVYLPSVWDNRHLVSVTGGYKFKKNWEVSTRYRLLGSTPFAPTDLDATLVNYQNGFPAVVKDYSQLGSEKLGAFSQWDIRVDKKWNFKKFSFDVYLDIQNVLGQAIPAEPLFGLDRDEDGTIISPLALTQVNTDVTGTTLPSLGIVLNF